MQESNTQESTNPSLTEAISSEAQCGPASGTDSETRHSEPQSIVPADFVEILRIPRPDPPEKEQEPEEEMTDEPDDNTSSPDEESMSGENTYHEQLQQTAKKEPKPSSITLEEVKKAVFRNAPFNKLMEKFQ